MSETKAKRRGPGRPEYVASEKDRRLVELARACGAPPDEIATALKIDKRTLYRHYREEMTNALAKLRVALSARATLKAMQGDNEMLKFWLRSHGGEGWQDRTRLEHTGPGGSALAPPNLVVGFLAPASPLGLTIDADEPTTSPA